MTIVARAPGKLVVLGEYAVLAGGPALVMAVDRHCSVELGPSADARCHVQSWAPVPSQTSFRPGTPSGIEVVDCVTGRWPAAQALPWQATLDSRPLHGRGGKLGLGSSAAALTAWAGAWSARLGLPPPGLGVLIALHTAWQAGAGSGIDVAASRLGGVLRYRLGEGGAPEIGSAALPEGVGFVGVFSGAAASTRDLVARFAAWRQAAPATAGAQLDAMREAAARGIAAAAANAAEEFLAATADYAKLLEALGAALRADIVTAEHRAIARLARRCGVAYKVSGAGGGDVGLALATDRAALEAFVLALPPRCEALRLRIDTAGLTTEEGQV